MTQRGRKSLEAVATTTVTSLKRPEPPEELGPDEANEWIATVGRLPAEWFSDGAPTTLAQYCRHVVRARRVDQLIRQMEESEDLDLRDYDKLLKMQERETRAILSCATKMRITQQSTLDREKRKNPKKTKPPWEQ